MFEELRNIDVERYSDMELKDLMRQILSILLQIDQKINNTSNQSPCNHCKKRDHCNGCDLLESQLPSENAGTNPQLKYYSSLLDNIIDANGKRQIKFNHADLKEIDRIRSDDIFTLYKNCSIIFSKCEWRVATLKIRDELTFKEISQIIGIAPSTASQTFYRAESKMKQHYKAKIKTYSVVNRWSWWKAKYE